MPDSLSDDDEDQELLARVAAARKRRLNSFPPSTLAWLALPPGWTEGLAHTCKFPRQQSNLREFITQACNAGLCEVSESIPGNHSEEWSFWMPSHVRRQTLLELRVGNDTTSLLRQAAAEIARSIPSNYSAVPPAVARWAEMAREATESAGTAAHNLTSRVRTLIEQNRTGEALAWVATGEDLAQVFGGSLETAVRAGNRLLELTYRQAQDNRYLKDFLERDEQIAAFHQLIRDDDHWALHYVGVGGVGKTMLLRYLTSALAPQLDNGPNLPPGRPTTRVDFDYLSPDYPASRPGQLLLELAVELRAYAANSRIENKLSEFQNTILEWHETLSNSGAPQAPLAALQGSLFDKAIRGFADILRVMERPVILILDTCEELAKSPIVNEMMPSVEATFAILERIQLEVSTVRVIFAGRRLLARSGSDWRINELAAPDHSDAALPVEGQFLPASKPYLSLHEIRGFTKNDNDRSRSEVDRYLTEEKQLSLPADLREAILARSRELGLPINILRTGPTPAREEARFNPFDLSLYRDWWCEDPTLTANTIRSGQTDPYVELRIVERIKQEHIRRVLPAVALLGRFDEHMLRPLIGDSSLFDVYRGLGEQEWISYQIDESRQVSLLEVNRSLHGRLLAYYEHPSRCQLLDDARRQLAPTLIDLARRPLQELASEHLDAALRVLPPTVGGEVWEDVVRRIPAERNWHWLQNVIKQLRSNVGAIREVTHPLFPAVRAAEVSAQIHLTPSLNVTSAWGEVAATAAKYPDPEVGRWLASRAVAGQVTASRDESLMPEFWRLVDEYPHESTERLRAEARSLVESPSDKLSDRAIEAARDRHFQLGASLIAALDSVLEEAERAGTPDLVPKQSDILRFAASLPSSDLQDFANTLALRALVLCDQMDDARSVQGSIATWSRQIPQWEERWFDWRAPDSQVDRLRLETLRLLPSDIPKEGRDAWVRDALGRLASIDAERLVSFLLQFRLANEVIPEEELKQLLQAEKYDANRRPICNAHRTAPPLIISISQGYLAIGQARAALVMLKQRSHELTKSAQDEAQQHAIEITEAQVIWRMRMGANARMFISQMASYSSNPHRQPLMSLLKTIFESPSATVPLIAWPQFLSAGPRHFAERELDIISVTGRNHVDKGFDNYGQTRVGSLIEVMDLFLSATRQVNEEGTSLDNVIDSFRQASDSVGELIATITWAIAAIHAGGLRTEPDRESVRCPLKDAYEQLDRSHQLPKWERLIELSMDPQPESLSFLANEDENPMVSDWGGWLQRLLGCLVWLNDTGNDHQQLEKWRGWLSRQYGHGLPFELDLPAVRPVTAEGDGLPASEYSNAWFASFTLIKLISSGLMALVLFISCWLAFFPGVNTGSEVWDYWKGILGVIAGFAFVANLFEEVIDDRSIIQGGWWYTFKRSLRREKEHPGQFYQLTVKTLGGLEVAGILGVFLSMVLGVVLLLRWLWKARVASLVSAHEPLTIELLVFFAFVALGLFFRKRIKSALQSCATWNQIYFVSGGAPDRPDATAIIDFTVSLRQHEIVFFFPVIEALPVHPIDWIIGGVTRMFVPCVSHSDAKQLTEIDPHHLQPAMGNLRRDIIRLIVRAYSPPAIETKVASQTPGLLAYSEARQKIPAEIVEQLKAINTRLWFLESSVALHVAPSLAFVPWEAMLTMAVEKETSRSIEDKLFFFRTGEPLPESAQERALQVWRESSVAVMGGAGWASLTKAWRLPESREPRSARILHLIGRPLMTGSGVRLQSEGEGVSSASFRSGNLIASSDVKQNSAWLVVLQDEPLEILERVETDREQSGLLRVFAAEVFHAGASAVLSLPPMSPALAEQVIRLLAERLELSAPPTPFQLAKTVNRVQRWIAAWRPSIVQADAAARAQIIAAQLEIALDVCLFARQRSIETVLSKQ
jgi:hypothetical protein